VSYASVTSKLTPDSVVTYLFHDVWMHVYGTLSRLAWRGQPQLIEVRCRCTL